MTRLLSETPLAGRGVSHGAMCLRESDPGRITWIAPYPGAEIATSHALKAAFSLSFPAPGEAQDSGGGRILWSGRSQALLLGPEPPEALSRHAAMLDQTEGWAAMTLAGAGSVDTLARLVPLDLRPRAFPAGRTARSLLGHVNAQITAIAGGFEILVMRSMARTAVHDIGQAMASVAARTPA